MRDHPYTLFHTWACCAPAPRYLHLLTCLPPMRQHSRPHANTHPQLTHVQLGRVLLFPPRRRHPGPHPHARSPLQPTAGGGRSTGGSCSKIGSIRSCNSDTNWRCSSRCCCSAAASVTYRTEVRTACTAAPGVAAVQAGLGVPLAAEDVCAHGAGHAQKVGPVLSCCCPGYGWSGVRTRTWVSSCLGDGWWRSDVPDGSPAAI